MQVVFQCGAEDWLHSFLKWVGELVPLQDGLVGDIAALDFNFDLHGDNAEVVTPNRDLGKGAKTESLRGKVREHVAEWCASDLGFNGETVRCSGNNTRKSRC